MPLNTVKSHMRRSLDWLRAQYAGWNVEPEMNAEFEKQLRGLISREDPGARFTEKVLALMKARMTNRPRARGRFIVIGVAAIALAAAAMLGLYLRNTAPTDLTELSRTAAPRSAGRGLPAEPQPSPGADLASNNALPEPDGERSGSAHRRSQTARGGSRRA